MMASGKRANSAVMPVESSPKHGSNSNYSTGATLKASSFDPETPVVSVLVQGRFGEFSSPPSSAVGSSSCC